MLCLAVPVEVPLVGGLRRDADREERQQRRDEVGARVRGLGDEARGCPRRAPSTSLIAMSTTAAATDASAVRRSGDTSAERYSEGGVATVDWAPPPRDQDPGGDERAAGELERVERLGEQDDGDRGGEERLEVCRERRARRPDPVERPEPELVRQDERAERREDEQRPDLPAEVPVLIGELRHGR